MKKKKSGRRKPPENGSTTSSGQKPQSDTSIARARGIKNIKWHAEYVLALRSSPSKSKAASAAGVSRDTARLHLDMFPQFRERVEAILDTWTDDIEETAIDLSIKGCQNPIFDKDGAEIGTKTDMPIPLIIFMLKTRRREQYGDKLSVDIGPARKMTEDEIEEAGKKAEESIIASLRKKVKQEGVNA